jgi:hypothetical protein
LYPNRPYGIKLEINSKENNKICSNSWRLNNTALNDPWVIENIRTEIKKYLESNENENRSYPNLWNTVKAVIEVKFIAMSAHIMNWKPPSKL